MDIIGWIVFMPAVLFLAVVLVSLWVEQIKNSWGFQKFLTLFVLGPAILSLSGLCMILAFETIL